MAGVYRPQHPERTVLYRVLFHYFDRFLSDYEGRFEKEYGLQIVFTIPRLLGIFLRYNRRLLGELCRLALRSLTHYFEAVAASALAPRVIAAIQTFGDRINFHPH